MSVRITTATEVAMFDSVTGIAFGETFQSAEDANGFLEYLAEIGEDGRVMTPQDLHKVRHGWEIDRQIERSHDG